MRSIIQKKGQVWVETVLYTLIGLAIIGIVLAVAKPKIDEMKDEIVINQIIESMSSIDEKVGEVDSVEGNRRSIDLKVGDGEFVVDGVNNMIIWRINSDYQYSEEDVVVDIGDFNVLTTKGDPWTVEIMRPYDFDIRFDSVDEEKVLEESSAPYSVYVENLGRNDDGKAIVSFTAD